MSRLLIAVLTILSLVAPASAESKIDILTILDQFMISKAVASKCTPPDKEKRAKFLLNMETVRLHATQRLKKMYPKATDEMIAKEGCDSPQIKEALRRFDVQADMNLFALTKDK